MSDDEFERKTSSDIGELLLSPDIKERDDTTFTNGGGDDTINVISSSRDITPLQDLTKLVDRDLDSNAISKLIIFPTIDDLQFLPKYNYSSYALSNTLVTLTS
ncbi:hypothetical protein EW146_g5306 [Bondarzewia mesenterica]|uniref:Uncharacterized protein n=1 Tax=Bondarzewia mesenterica TaxID=1095465 RepID=A0A4S4LU00_9AGAM|nr:hypothetical protein EW146_g5306 [Bondarzewia mesenterica]